MFKELHYTFPDVQKKTLKFMTIEYIEHFVPIS